MRKLFILQIKIPQEWKKPLEQKIQQKGYVTTSEAILGECCKKDYKTV